MKSSGILVFRKPGKDIEFFLVHPGGPFFKNKNEGFWTIPKGLLSKGEKPLDAGIREFAEETGFELRFGIEEFIDLGIVVQKGGKQVYGFGIEADFSATSIVSNTFEIEWPPRSGKKTEFPEVDKARWFSLTEARKLINTAQAAFLDRLIYEIKR